MEGVGDKTTSEGHLISAAAFVQGVKGVHSVQCVGNLLVSKTPLDYQELLETVVQERSFRFNPPRNATIFRHPTLGDFELQNQAYFKCAYECFDRKQEEIANCVEHCSIPVVKSQQYFEGEMAQFQVSVLRRLATVSLR